MNTAAKSPKLVKYNGGFFTINRPSGWKVKTAGRGSTLAFLVRDPGCSMRQIFCFTSVGPFYDSQQQKASEINYMRAGGYPIQWVDMPVVAPLTAQSFFEQFSNIANTKIAKGFMPDMPHLANFRVVSVQNIPMQAQGFSAQLIRAVFSQNGRVGQGQFAAAVGNVAPYAWAFMVTGITAPMKEFKQLQPAMAKSLSSFNLSKKYVQQCLNEQNENFKGLLRAGRTMSETSDIIMKGWEERNKTYDIISEKRSDAILGYDRYYDPNTREVYEYEVGHTPRTGQLPLPENDYDLWMKAPKNGERR